jgi:hypothetical protein
MKKFIINEKKESKVITIDFSAIQHLITFSENACEINVADCCIDCNNAEVAQFVYNSLKYKVPTAFAANINRIYFKKFNSKYTEAICVHDSYTDALLNDDYSYNYKDSVLFINVIKHTYYFTREEEK